MRRSGLMSPENSSMVRCLSPALVLCSSSTFAMVCAMRESSFEIPDASIIDLSPAVLHQRVTPPGVQLGCPPAARVQTLNRAHAPFKHIGVDTDLQWVSSCL